MPFSKYNGKGLNGLANLGNTCFMNSVLQCLGHTYELYEIENEKLTDNIYDVKIFNEYFKLLHFMWNENSTVSPNGFLRYVQFVSKKKNREMFTGFDQNDFSEFLLFLLSCFHESIKKIGPDSKSKNKIVNEYINKTIKKDYSEITRIFNGIQINTIISKENNNEILNTNVEQFTILSLPIPEKKNTTIIDCFDEYFKDIELFDENKYVLPEKHINAGEKVDAILKSKIYSFPEILIVNLLRVNITSNNMTKNEKLVSYDEKINLDKYCLEKNNNYELYAIGEHHGNLYGGHYTSLVKTSNGKWYNFNDMIVKERNKIESNRAYTFFYRKSL